MSPEERARTLAVLNMIREDVSADVERRDGLPFTSQTVSEALGEICAQTSALAGILIAVIEDSADPLVHFAAYDLAQHQTTICGLSRPVVVDGLELTRDVSEVTCPDCGPEPDGAPDTREEVTTPPEVYATEDDFDAADPNWNGKS